MADMTPRAIAKQDLVTLADNHLPINRNQEGINQESTVLG
jgi:hypothetical protein